MSFEPPQITAVSSRLSFFMLSSAEFIMSFIPAPGLTKLDYCIDPCPHFMGLLIAQKILAMNSKIYPLDIFLVVIRNASYFVLE